MKELYVLVGAQGAGKSTHCQSTLPFCVRVSQDDQGKDGHKEVFFQALEEGRPIVVDRINHRADQRAFYISQARQRGYTVKIVWLTEGFDVCAQRIVERKGHPTLPPEKANQALSMYFKDLQPPDKSEADELILVGPNPFPSLVDDVTDLLRDTRYIIVGDLHGCFDELIELLHKLDFDDEKDCLISCGDLVDRGPKVVELLAYLRSLPRFLAVKGNHEDKFIRWSKGNPIKVSDGLQKTIDDFQEKAPNAVQAVAQFFRELPYILKTPAGYVVHAGFDPSRSVEEQRKSDCLYTRHIGGADAHDPAGEFWFKLWKGPPVFFGHIVLSPEEAPTGPTYGLDGGCVFGGELRAWDSRDGKVHSVQAKQSYHENSHKPKPVEKADVHPVKIRDEYVEKGLLRCDISDDQSLVVYTYTDSCTYDRAWDEITINSRGHVFDRKTGECVARPFSKFFNLSTTPETMAEVLDWASPFRVYEKYDGWLAVLYRQDGKFKISTRGSFHSLGAIAATKWIQTKDLSFLPDEVTLCFELISPEQRIILNYGEDIKLVLLAGFNRHTGEEYDHEQLEKWAAQAGIEMAQLHPYTSLAEMLEYQAKVEDREGFVIRFSSGLRVKIKTEWYRRLSKILSTLSPIALWDVMHEGKVPSDFLVALPPEAKVIAQGFQDSLEQQYARVYADTLTKAKALISHHNEDRKQIALNREHLKGHPSYSAVFSILLGQWPKVHEIVKEAIYPRGNEFINL